MAVTQWAETYFCAAHRSAQGVLHGHTWRVRAHWNDNGCDIEVRSVALKHRARQLDHTELDPSLARAESIAEWFGRQLDAIRVDVWREAEGFGATWNFS